MTSRAWARFFSRVILGLIFFMAGWYKCFEMTPLGHATNYFTGPYADTWIPHWLLLATGVAIPVLELAAGFLLIVGFRTRDALVAVGFILIVVTYGHLLKEPLFALTGHIFPRGILMILLFLIPDGDDYLALDRWLPFGKLPRLPK